MNARLFLSIVVIVLLLGSASGADARIGTAVPAAPEAQAGTAFTYQGQIDSGGSPINSSCDFQFALYDASVSETQIGTTQTSSNVSVTNGAFTVLLDFGSGVFNGDARWLEMAARCPAGSGNYTLLTPRQALTPVPYALALPGIQTQQNMTSTNIIGGYKGNYITPGVVGATIGGGGSEGGSRYHRITDDFGTVGGGDVNQAGNGNGITGDAPYATVCGGNNNTASGFTSIVAGGTANLASGSESFIGGGHLNIASNTWGTVGGGQNNVASGGAATIGGGGTNNASGSNSTIGGGVNNNAKGDNTTIAGGWSNVANSDRSTIGGGWNNVVSNTFATVGGGAFNTASGGAAIVPGGVYNSALGDYSFAAGRRAKANHPGSFVWGDSTDADVTSTGANQFVVRASGGVTMMVGGGAFRLVPTSYTSPNIIGGYSDNSIAITNTEGATIGGGGGNGLPNRIFVGSGTASFATISGGANNAASGYLSTIGGGANNVAADSATTVAGGHTNQALAVGAAVGGGSYNTANGDEAFIGGGECNTASGKFATISGGGHNYEVQCNTASAEYATIPGGANTLASIYGQFAYATGGFSNPGDAQTSMFVLRNQTVDATPTDLYLDGTGQRLSLANNRTLTFDVLVVARSNANASAGYQIRGVIENNAGTTSLIGTPIVTTLGEDVATWNVNVVADDTNDALAVQVTGAASTTIRWVATVRTTEVAW